MEKQHHEDMKEMTEREHEFRAGLQWEHEKLEDKHQSDLHHYPHEGKFVHGAGSSEHEFVH